MPEYRQNPVTGQWVILSADRAKRPNEFKSDVPRPAVAEYVKGCPFCPGHERRTPPEVFAVRDDYATVDKEGWRVRVVPNKYPAVKIDAEGVPTPESVAMGKDGQDDRPDASDLRVTLPGVGMHEVVVESPAHDRHFAKQPAAQAEQIVHTLRHRSSMISQARDVKLVSIFKNHGTLSGTTILHPHFQIIAPAVIPPFVKTMVERQASYAAERGRPLFEALLEQELEAGLRIVASNDEFVTLTPWASASPYEMWILPREQAAFFQDLPDGHIPLFTAGLQDALQRLDRLLDNPDYNLVIHTGPKWRKSKEAHRWFAQIAPRTSLSAGFELGTNMYINAVGPETAAAALRDA